MAISGIHIYGPSSSDIPGTEMNLFYNLWRRQQSCFFALNTDNGKKPRVSQQGASCTHCHKSVYF